MPVSASAQELEPGAYWPIPTRLNILTVANNFNWGDVAFDPSAPIDEASARINTTAFAFTRAFSLAGRSANAGVVLPVIGGHIEGLYLGEPAEVGRFGQGDPRLRLAMNLYGAPAMTPQQFASYRHQTIVGVSVTVAPPIGQYDSTKLINLGTNRWSFKPEVGLSQAWASGSWRRWRGSGSSRTTRIRRRTHAGAGSDCRDAGPRHLQVHAQHVAGGGCQLLHRWSDDDRREAEPRSPAQLTNRGHVFVGDRSRPGNSRVGESGRLHHDRCGFHFNWRRLQLRLGALTLDTRFG